MPRKYDMGKRSAAVERTRRRIVEATMELHNTQGVLATSWEEIARRADVSPATVYRHFPSLEELLPACGQLSFRKLDLPSEAAFERRLRGIDEPERRLIALIGELFAIYERGGEAIWAIRRDRERLRQLQAAHEEIEARIAALTRIALDPLQLGEERVRAVRAILDFHTWSALRDRAFDPEGATRLAAELLGRYLGLDDARQGVSEG